MVEADGWVAPQISAGFKRQNFSARATSNSRQLLGFLLGVRAKRYHRAECLEQCVRIFPASLHCHPWGGWKHILRYFMGKTKCSCPVPSAFPEHGDSPTLPLWHVRVPEWPSSRWHVEFAVALEQHCPNQGQTCKTACGKLLVISKTEKPQKGKLRGLALWQHDPAPTRSAQQNALCLEQWPHQALWVGAARFRVRGGGMQMADTVCELTFLPQGLLGRIDYAAQKVALADVIDVGLALSTAYAVVVKKHHRWHRFFKTPLSKSFKTKLAISVCIDPPFLLLIFALCHYWCEEQGTAIVALAHGWKEI